MSLRSIYDEQQINLLRNGDETTFTQIYTSYSEKLYYNIVAMVKDENTAEELVQDIFTHIWQKRSSIPPKVNLEAYLYRVSRNRVCDFFRGLKRKTDLYEHIKEIATTHYQPFEFIQQNNDIDLLEKAIASLPPQRRKAFVLCKFEGCSYLQASQKMGVSLSTVKDHMAHAQSFIRKFVLQHSEVAVSLIFLYLWNRRS